MFKDITGKQRMDEIIGPIIMEEVHKSTDDVPIDDNYMGFNGILYFKCEKCKCWCVYENQHEYGYKVCSFCEKNAEKTRKV